jgi:hypothetical protein
MTERSATRRLYLENECKLGRHLWHPTLITSIELCLHCGAKRYCIACHSGIIPPGAISFLCLTHQAVESMNQEVQA